MSWTDDLTNCCLAGQRDRFEHELLRLRGYSFRSLLVERHRPVARLQTGGVGFSALVLPQASAF